MKEIVGIGAGYVGGPTMSMIAEQCPHLNVTVVDINTEKIERWNSDHLPIFEPGLDDLVKRIRGRNLFFSTNIEDAIAKADIIFVSVNTPTKTFGIGAGFAADLQYWEKTARQIKDNATKPVLVVEKSTVPVRTAEAMERILNDHQGGPDALHFEVLSCPEFLAEGTAIQDLLDPERVLIGGRHDKESGRQAMQALVDIFSCWVPEEKIICSNIWSAELSKLASNAFLAQRVSSINAVSALCEKTDADVTEVARAIGLDRRIGPHFLKTSVGFGGSCFKKDILNLVYLCRYYGLEEVAEYWHWVVKLNDYQMNRFVDRIIKEMFNTVAGKRIVIFGAAFKANTGDTRESPGVAVARRLIQENAEVVITDPKAIPNARMDMQGERVTFIEDPYEASKDAHAIALVTEWAEYKSLDYGKVFSGMVKPAFVFDGRNILDHRGLHQLGFHVFPIGKPALSRFAEE